MTSSEELMATGAIDSGKVRSGESVGASDGGGNMTNPKAYKGIGELFSESNLNNTVAIQSLGGEFTKKLTTGKGGSTAFTIDLNDFESMAFAVGHNYSEANFHGDTELGKATGFVSNTNLDGAIR